MTTNKDMLEAALDRLENDALGYRDGYGTATKDAALIRAALSDEQWHPIETAPRNKPVLVGYYNSSGKWRTVKAMFIAEHTIETEPFGDFGQYFEEEDAFYCPEGWYEDLEDAGHALDVSFYQMSYKPTHWMPLPKPPTEVQNDHE